MYRLIIIVLAFVSLNVSAQKPNYDIRCPFGRPIKSSVLTSPKNISDLIANYPTTWITEYESSEISLNQNGKISRAYGKNNALTLEQEKLLSMATVGDGITIIVKYKTKNAVTNQPESSKMKVDYTITPDVQAESAVNDTALNNYFNESVINKISYNSIKRSINLSLKFIVNENGEITDAALKSTSGDSEVDQLALKALIDMPKWKPAQSLKGTKQKQEFVFVLSNTGC